MNAILQMLIESYNAQMPQPRPSNQDDYVEFSALLQMKAVVPAYNLEVVQCDTCADESMLVETTSNGTYRGYCIECGYTDIPAEALTIYKLDFNWLCRQIVMAMSIVATTASTPPPSPIIDNLFWNFGLYRFQQLPFKLYFIRRLTSEHDLMVQFREYLERTKSKTPTIIFTTSDIKRIHCARPKNVTLLNIEETMEFRSGRFIIDESIIRNIMKGQPSQQVVDGIGCYFSPDFRLAEVNGIQYKFSKKQAAIMEELINQDGYAHKDALSAAANTKLPPNDIFRSRTKGRHPAWNKLIKPEGNGYYACPLK